MRRRLTGIVIIIALTVCLAMAAGEGGTTDTMSCDAWDWENETVNSFGGEIDQAGWEGKEITLRLRAEFEPENESANERTPKFTTVNGKRKTMLEQSDSIVFTPEGDRKSVQFEASLQMPEKGHYQRIALELTASDPDGKELKRIPYEVTAGGTSAQGGRVIYIPFEIRDVAIILAAAAALVWGLAILRNRILNRKG